MEEITQKEQVTDNYMQGAETSLSEFNIRLAGHVRKNTIHINQFYSI